MKILYLSCHSILEYDEVKLFTELGHDVFSHGSYANPAKPGDPKRPAVKAKFNQKLYDISLAHSKDDLHKDMIKWADVIIVMHKADWILKNLDKFGKKPVIWRSIGQSTIDIEGILWPLRQKGLGIVRYSNREQTIPGYCGSDAVIPFYKDPEEFKNWTGYNMRILTIGQSMRQRREFCNWDLFEKVTDGLPRLLVGPGNDDVKTMDQRLVKYAELKKLLRASRVYFYTGTYPASYTLNFIEAMMTGIPIVAVGPKYGNSPFQQGQNTYEIPEIIENGVNGFCSDDPGMLRVTIKELLADKNMANSWSQAGRKTAIEWFGKKKIAKQWEEFFNAL